MTPTLSGSEILNDTILIIQIWLVSRLFANIFHHLNFTRIFHESLPTASGFNFVWCEQKMSIFRHSFITCLDLLKVNNLKAKSLSSCWKWLVSSGISVKNEESCVGEIFRSWISWKIATVAGRRWLESRTRLSKRKIWKSFRRWEPQIQIQFIF